MREVLATVAALAAGAAVMYYLDPDRGRSRRAIARDRTVSLSHDAGDYARASGRRAAHRIRGLAASGREQLHPSQPGSDAQLRERIRSRMGRIVSHPRAIDVEVVEGRVRLDGHILREDLEPLLSMVSRTSGVASVEDGLSVHDEKGRVPALQGAGRFDDAAASNSMKAVMAFMALAAPVGIFLGAAGRSAWRRGASY